MNNYLLGQFIREKRESLGMSLREFGRICNISHTTIDCIEKGYDPRTGKDVNITKNTFGKLSEALKVPVAKLVELSQGVENAPTPEGERKIGFDDFTYAFYEESKDLPDEKKKMLLDMARFMKADIDKGKG